MDLGERLESALAQQRIVFVELVEAGALQFACAAQQELHEINEAEPSEPLSRAVDHLRSAIAAMRALAASQLAVHEQFVIDANAAITEDRRVSTADIDELSRALAQALRPSLDVDELP